MSRLSRWDQQLNQIERVIIELARDVSLTPDPQVQDTTFKNRDEIDADLARIAINLDKVNQAAKKSKAANRTNAAIGWGAKQLVTKLKVAATEYVALQNRKMWLRLLQARFSGISTKDSLDLEAKHLVELAVRRKQLEDLEAALRQDLEFIAQERELLKVEYGKISTADENWSASGSFQSRLGVNKDHAKENPSSRALSECLSAIRVPTMHPEEDAWLQQANEELQWMSEELAQQSRDLASALVRGQNADDKIIKGRFKKSIENLSTLKDNVLERFSSVKGKAVAVSRPKLVQSSQKGAKTIAHP